MSTTPFPSPTSRPARRAALLALAVAAGGLIAPRHTAAQGTARITAPGAALLDRPARLVVHDVSLADALGALERQSGVPLAYSPSLLPSDRSLRCACSDATIGQALEQLLASAPFAFRETHGQIVIVPMPRDAGQAANARGTDPLPAAAPENIGALGLVTPAALPADSGVVTGRVTNDAGTPVSGATVAIRSLRLSATTNDAGIYRIDVPPDRFVARSDTLRVTRLGYRPATVRFTLAPGRVIVDVAMTTQAVSLEQVVVTGTAGNQERRAQAAVVSTIDATEVASKAPVLDVNELLYARTPGVSMTKGSGTSGSNTRIDIRGQASISLSNYPLVFVDGVRIVAGPRSVVTAPGGTTAGAGGQQFSALNDLNPDDIESIEIVKGPAASTLYGSDASAGVIQILTKKGRLGGRRFTQTITTEYDRIDPNFTPYAAYGACTAALVAANSPNPLCRGQAAGTVVSDNVLARNDVFDNGLAASLQYAAQGGTENFGFYGSAGMDYERGTSPSSYLQHRNGRVNATWSATPKLRLEVSAPFARNEDRLPQGDQSSLGFLLGGILGSPLTVTQGADGKLAGGWFNNNATVDAIAAINTTNLTMRSTPSFTANYVPFEGFTNRLTVGADLVRTNASQFYPRNDKNWYSATANTGSIGVVEQYATIYTVDYLANLNHKFGREGQLSSDLSLGSQWINTSSSSVGATGQGLVANSNNLVSAATTTVATQALSQQISFGFFAQEQLGFKDRLFVQLGGRADRNSAFGKSVGTFFLPKAGISYVVSDEPFWRGLSDAVSTLRLRAAYGATGRSPAGTASLQTYTRAPYITDAGVVQPGVTPGSPGNADLKPERGTEFEAGFDAGFLRDRVGLELTYFDKRTKDLLLPLPLPPSSGFASNPLVNIGEVTNKGLEIGLRATPVQQRNVTWDANVNVNTLSNEIVSMGNITPFVSNNQCFKPGVEVAGWCVPQVLSVDTVAGRATVSDTAQFVGGNLPKYGGSFATTLTLFRRLRLYALVDGKFDYNVYNLTKDFRDRSLGNSGEVRLSADQGGYSKYERLRRLGPFRAATSGATVGNTLVRGPYIEEGDYVRFREVSATFTLPETLTRSMRLGAASVSIGGRNLGLWTKYSGWDPEVLGTVDVTTPFLGDVFTLPQSSRAFARLTVQF